MTGRRAGLCAGYPGAGWQHPIPGGRGGAFRRGRGFHGSPRGLSRGRKFRASFPADPEALQVRRDALRSELEYVEQELSKTENK